MKLQFSATEQYQLDAISAIVDLFEGQNIESGDFTVATETPSDQLQLGGELLIGNQLGLDEKQIIENTQKIQKRNEVSPEEALFAGMNFSIEMETGTGKTYTYLRSIHELHAKYGFKKFVIVVPSLAIKEGVLKNIEITKDHFALLYGNPKINTTEYSSRVKNSGKRSAVRSFARNDSLQILVINIDSFAKDKNVINQIDESGEKPMELLRKTSPIVIIDEPQNMETEKRKTAIESLNPLCTLRYSATHKNHYNLLYKLDPVKAYDLRLVKQIEVDSVYSEDAFNDAYIKVIGVKSDKRKVWAMVKVDKSDEVGLQSKVIKIESGDDLEELTGREVYKGFVLDSIDVSDQKIIFDNGKSYRVGQKDEGLQKEIMKYQVKRTVENHFEKELKLKDEGIKVLSLFFIDRVANYRQHTETGALKGKLAEWFEEAYLEMQKKPKYKGLLKHNAEEVHDGYFSKDKKTKKWKDSKDTGGEGGKTKEDADTYHLIMRDKERLLSIEEPLRFIFSHSALREGWDNPNVFQICTLNESTSEMKKRQEIGRGLRLPVDQNGERVRDDQINILTIVPNESYEDFAKSLQKEIEDDCGVSFGSSRIKDKRKRVSIKLKKEFQLDKNFKALWDRIKHKTQYRVDYDTEDLITKTAKILKEEVTIRRPRISSITTRIEKYSKGMSGRMITSRGQDVDQIHAIIPDVLGNIQKRTKLTKGTIFEILKEASKLKDVLVNPQQLIDEVVRVIDVELNRMSVDGIKYEKIANECYEMHQFEEKELEGYLNNLVKVNEQEKTLYDHIQIDSETVERLFAEDLDSREDVKFYFKLPSWFKIKTPIGSYNPDWAVVFKQDERVYFVAETKSENQELRESEKIKIKCGKKHFAKLEGVEFIAPTHSLQDAIDKVLK